MICRLFIVFIIFSFLGWIYEIIFCIFKTGKWENRGFLYGPVCPIYGVGAVSIYIINLLYTKNFHIELNEYIIFFVSLIGSFVLEYLTHYILEKLFSAVWWDYKDVPLNINGRVCLPATLVFGLMGIVVIKYLMPVVIGFVLSIDYKYIELFSLFAMAIFAIDITLTVCALTKFLENVNKVENAFNNKMDSFVSGIVDLQQIAITRVKEFRIPNIKNIKNSIVLKFNHRSKDEK